MAVPFTLVQDEVTRDFLGAGVAELMIVSVSGMGLRGQASLSRWSSAGLLPGLITAGALRWSGRFAARPGASGHGKGLQRVIEVKTEQFRIFADNRGGKNVENIIIGLLRYPVML